MKHMQSTILGFPRIGAQRELKRALERYWKGRSSEKDLEETARALRSLHWKHQMEAGIDVLPVNDFSLYDAVLDLTFQLGAVPERYKPLEGESKLRRYFAMARGEKGEGGVTAMEMSKWFDTNYHYIVPEFSKRTSFADLSNAPAEDIKILAEIEEAVEAVKGDVDRLRPVLIGPVTYFALGKCIDDVSSADVFHSLLDSYITLVQRVVGTGVRCIQFDEPLLVTNLDEITKSFYVSAYEKIAQSAANIEIFLATYFGGSAENTELISKLPVHVVHVDLVRGNAHCVQALAKSGKRISLGLIDGRNIWKSNLSQKLSQLSDIVNTHKDGNTPWFVSSSCSLLHSPFDTAHEKKMDGGILRWLSFAMQKLREVALLSLAYNSPDDAAVQSEIQSHTADVKSRTLSDRVHKTSVKERVSSITPDMTKRKSDFEKRKIIQRENLKMPLFPTTTIGSYPQTPTIRKSRADFKKNVIIKTQYDAIMRASIREVVSFQEKIDMDVLVHGEPERNDMVEYFGERFDGYASTENGWVQSYGSRCVKPPIIYGDLTRESPITVEWITYAQSLTKRPMKAMLTGPITILQWSFVRDDQSLRDTALQIALLMRDEVTDLERAGISVIQVDEPAMREGLPLKKHNQANYLKWAVEAFKLSTCSVKDSTQIHTHMCYSEFDDIIQSIAALDADVISMEASRSRMDLLNSFKHFDYPNDIGPGVYDIHSPRIPSTKEIVDLLENAVRHIPKEQLWVNPDCGLKTRVWDEVKPSLANMVEAAKIMREKHAQG